MGKDPSELYEEQRRKQLEQKQNVRGTMETVGLEQQEAQQSTFKYQGIIVNVLAVIGAIAVAYVVLDLIF